jgi:hypothetical protein
MMRAPLVLVVLALAAPVATAAPHKKKPAPKKDEKSPEQKEADRHFKSGVALFGEQKFGEALAEFERAYEIAPAPIVLLNIAACHRELSHYAEAVKFYNRFLSEGEGKVGKDRLAAAKTELDGILARIARVTVTVTGGEGATLSLDGNALGTMPIDMPLILAPGDHKLSAHLEGKRDADKSLHVASGDDLKAELALVDAPKEQPKVIERVIERPAVVVAHPFPHKTFELGAGFGTNLQRVSVTGAPSVGLGVAIGSRLELGVDVVLVAYAVMPSVRVRLAGDQVSVHLVGAAPINFTDGTMSETFFAGAGGFALRIRATPALALTLESLASFATKGHGTTFPAFVGGEVWF